LRAEESFAALMGIRDDRVARVREWRRRLSPIAICTADDLGE
jgi:hypothetical protein